MTNDTTQHRRIVNDKILRYILFSFFYEVEYIFIKWWTLRSFWVSVCVRECLGICTYEKAALCSWMTIMMLKIHAAQPLIGTHTKTVLYTNMCDAIKIVTCDYDHKTLVLHPTPSIKEKIDERTSLTFWFAAKKYRFIFCLHRMSNSVRSWRLRGHEDMSAKGERATKKRKLEGIFYSSLCQECHEKS